MFQPFSKFIAVFFFAICIVQDIRAQHTIMREWNELLLTSIGEDLNRSNVQARNIFHFSAAMYDAWAAYDGEAQTYLLGKTVNGYTCPFQTLPKPQDIEAARKEAMSFAAFRFLASRFSKSPQSSSGVYRSRNLMQSLGFDPLNHKSNYSSGSPAALGNYIAQCVLQMGAQDDSREETNYIDPVYKPRNPPMEVMAPGTGNGVDPNRWQPLKLKSAIDLDGYPVYECSCLGRRFSTLLDSVDDKGRRPFTGTQTCQGVDWGRVKPFALERKDLKIFQHDRRDYFYYHDIGDRFFTRLDTLKGAGTSDEYKWNYALVAAWSALLNPADTLRWDVSPGNMGNLDNYPSDLAELHRFYDPQSGRNPGAGHSLNPHTGFAYQPVWIPRGEYMRAASRYWAEGPKDQTPPGHWLALLNYVSDQPGLVKKFNGKGKVMGDLEWAVKACFVLGAAMHDAAIAAWGLKGRFDGPRPITALRYMASKGQSSDPGLPSYHPAGISLWQGCIELIGIGDTLAGTDGEHLGKVKFFTWKGPRPLSSTPAQPAGIGWVLGENWFPYQQISFVSPPFGGFVSSHATFAHAGAEALNLLTGDPYFPGGMGEYLLQADSQIVRFEKSPVMDIPLQWATYRDAADQASLSAIWAGIQAPCDDIPGRIIGKQTGEAAFNLAKTYFYQDRDADGFLSYEDCDDNNPRVHPGAVELCDGLDNDCNGIADDMTPPCNKKKKG